MNYELAVELKKAGFPQGEHIPLSVPRLQIQEVEGSYVKFPTLSELIEECVSDNFVLRYGKEYGGIWTASPDWYEDAIGGTPNGDGATPEEAVARLYIALNKK